MRSSAQSWSTMGVAFRCLYAAQTDKIFCGTGASTEILRLDINSFFNDSTNCNASKLYCLYSYPQLYRSLVVAKLHDFTLRHLFAQRVCALDWL